MSCLTIRLYRKYEFQIMCSVNVISMHSSLLEHYLVFVVLTSFSISNIHFTFRHKMTINHPQEICLLKHDSK